jgi:hypothetical protein
MVKNKNKIRRFGSERLLENRIFSGSEIILEDLK